MSKGLPAERSGAGFVGGIPAQWLHMRHGPAVGWELPQSAECFGLGEFLTQEDKRRSLVDWPDIAVGLDRTGKKVVV